MFWLCSLCFCLLFSSFPVAFLFLSMHTFSRFMSIQCTIKKEKDMGQTIISVNNRVQVHPYLSDGHTGEHKHACAHSYLHIQTLWFLWQPLRESLPSRASPPQEQLRCWQLSQIVATLCQHWTFLIALLYDAFRGPCSHSLCGNIMAGQWGSSPYLIIFDDKEDGLDEEVLEAEVDMEYNLTRPRKDWWGGIQWWREWPCRGWSHIQVKEWELIPTREWR